MNCVQFCRAIPLLQKQNNVDIKTLQNLHSEIFFHYLAAGFFVKVIEALDDICRFPWQVL